MERSASARLKAKSERGTISTDINRVELVDGSSRRARASHPALEWFGTPIDVAEPAVWLYSDMSGFVTDTNILVKAG